MSVSDAIAAGAVLISIIAVVFSIVSTGKASSIAKRDPWATVLADLLRVSLETAMKYNTLTHQLLTVPCKTIEEKDQKLRERLRLGSEVEKKLVFLKQLKPEMQPAWEAWVDLTSPDDSFFENTLIELSRERAVVLESLHGKQLRHFLATVQNCAGNLH